MLTTDADGERLYIAPALVDDLIAERLVLAAGAKQAHPERDTLMNCIGELELDVATLD